MAVWGLSDYGRCAFGSGCLPASPTMYVKARIIPRAGLVACNKGVVIPATGMTARQGISQ
jgi:hypothetical protein